MDPFQRRQLGRTTVMLPQLGLGGAPIGNLYGPVSEADAQATLAAAWEGGVRYFDTSPWYGRGLSELRLGHFLRQQTRNDFILATKVGRLFRVPTDVEAYAASPRSWEHALLFEHHYDYSYDGVMRSWEDSLTRLGLTHVDMLLIHDLDIGNMKSETLYGSHLGDLAKGGIRALRELKATGRIGAIGAGINHLGTIPRFLDLIDLDFFLVASPYTLLDQPVLDLEFPLCESRGVGIIVGQVFASGILATGAIPGARYNYREAPPDVIEKVRGIEAVCARHGVPLAAASMQFPLHHPLVASIIPGAFAPEQVERNIATMRTVVPDALWVDLKKNGLLREDAPTP